jgi:hypothetical protein
LIFLPAEAALAVASFTVNTFLNALPFDIAGTVVTSVDVSMDNLSISGDVLGSIFSNGGTTSVGGFIGFNPTSLCVTLPIGFIPGVDEIFGGAPTICIP